MGVLFFPIWVGGSAWPEDASINGQEPREGLSTKREVKMAGYWLGSVSDHKQAERERGQYPANLTESVLSIKDVLYETTRADKIVPSCLLGTVTQSQLRIQFILPTHVHGASHVIITLTVVILRNERVSV